MEVISWDNLQDYLSKRLAALLPVKSAKRASIFVGPDASSLGLRIPVGAEDAFEASPYREIHIQLKTVDGNRVVELSTSAQDLFRKFYLFSLDVIELLERASISVPQAIGISLESWGQLLSRKALMSEAAQLGLCGELCFLEALIAARGLDALKAWTGPRGESHDFRIESDEFEVKSTKRNQRIHIVNGLRQLEPTTGKRLFLLSLHFELAGSGSGYSLPERISKLRGLVDGDGVRRGELEEGIKRTGYCDADAAFYSDRLQMRNPPYLIPIDKACPRITSAELISNLGQNVLQRIGEVNYEISVEGLGYPENSQQYESVLHGIPKIGEADDPA
jgi:hypothetical protein